MEQCRVRWSLLALLAAAACGRVNFDARSDAAGDTNADAYAGPNRVFITSSKHDGDFGGFVGADGVCQATADGIGLGGEFVALLWSTDGSGPSVRLGSSRGWVDMVGRPIADLSTDFDLAHAFNTIAYDESGNRMTVPELLWVGHQSGACTDWTTNTNTVTVTVTTPNKSLWAFTPSNGDCSVPEHLICVERGRVVPVAQAHTTGRIAFISTTTFFPGGGVAAADMICHDDALAAGLGGTFLAWLGGSAGGPESRFTPGGGPYIRPDGVLLAPGDELLSTQPDTLLATYLDHLADGSFTVDKRDVWTGTNGMHCSDWTDSTFGAGGFLGRAQSDLMTTFRNDSASPCGLSSPVVCLQL